WSGLRPRPERVGAVPAVLNGTRVWGGLRRAHVKAPTSAALSAVPTQRVPDKSKPPPCRRETREIRAASLDHLNDPIPRGSSADSGGYVLVGDGSRGPSRLTSSPLFIRPFMLARVDDRRFWISAVLPAASVRW